MDREEFVLIWHGHKKCYGGLLSAICSLKIAKRIPPASATNFTIFCQDFPRHWPVRSILCCLRSGSPSRNNFSISGPPSFGKSLICISLGAYSDFPIYGITEGRHFHAAFTVTFCKFYPNRFLSHWSLFQGGYQYGISDVSGQSRFLKSTA